LAPEAAALAPEAAALAPEAAALAPEAAALAPEAAALTRNFVCSGAVLQKTFWGLRMPLYFYRRIHGRALQGFSSFCRNSPLARDVSA
ncbi:MAG: hypothetical protein LBP88_05445, partial [Treponema sp.]|nr:hypothetical protein [Treponema sp.]